MPDGRVSPVKCSQEHITGNVGPRLRHIPSTAGRSVDQTVRLPVVYEEISYRAVCIRPSCTSLPVASYPRSESGTRCTDDYPLASADIVFGLRGTWARMVIPCSGLESIESKPSTNFIRSVMLVRPSPCPPVRAREVSSLPTRRPGDGEAFCSLVARKRAPSLRRSRWHGV